LAKALLLVSLACTTANVFMIGLAVVFSLDALYGLYILQYVYSKSTNHQTIDNLIEDKETSENIEVQEEKENKNVNKIFRKGWK
jgi:hypothetical protein